LRRASRTPLRHGRQEKSTALRIREAAAVGWYGTGAQKRAALAAADAVFARERKRS
jgi:hypothetical protein